MSFFRNLDEIYNLLARWEKIIENEGKYFEM